MDEEVNSVVIDTGSDTMKCGFGGDDDPRFVLPTTVGFAPENSGTNHKKQLSNPQFIINS